LTKRLNAITGNMNVQARTDTDARHQIPTNQKACSHTHTHTLGKTLYPKGMENKLVDTCNKHFPYPVRCEMRKD